MKLKRVQLDAGPLRNSKHLSIQFESPECGVMGNPLIKGCPVDAVIASLYGLIRHLEQLKEHNNATAAQPIQQTSRNSAIEYDRR